MVGSTCHRDVTVTLPGQRQCGTPSPLGEGNEATVLDVAHALAATDRTPSLCRLGEALGETASRGLACPSEGTIFQERRHHGPRDPRRVEQISLAEGTAGREGAEGGGPVGRPGPHLGGLPGRGCATCQDPSGSQTPITRLPGPSRWSESRRAALLPRRATGPAESLSTGGIGPGL